MSYVHSAERISFFLFKVYSTFSVKMVYKMVRGWVATKVFVTSQENDIQTMDPSPKTIEPRANKIK